MSKHKRNRNRQNLSMPNILPTSEIESENQESQESIEQLPQTESGKGRFLTYLRTHLWLVGIIGFLALGALGAGLKYLDDDARREISRRANSKRNLNDKSEQSFLNKVNPFLPTPTPTPLPLSKEYLYAGSRLLAVEDAAANAAPPADLAI